jgi:tetratricopeptide (TPR) repeat protein
MPGDPVSLRAFDSCGWLRAARAAGLLLTALVLTTASPVWAEGKQDARHHYDQATAAFGLGHFLEAAEHYQAAFSLRPEPALLYDAAQAYRLGGNKQRALELYRNYARLYDNAPNVVDARKHAADLEHELSAVPSPDDVPSGTDALVVPTGDATSPAPPGPSSPTATPSDGSQAGAQASAPDLELAPPPAPSSSSNLTLAATPATRDTPSLARRPWFWVAIGAVVAAGVLAVVLATGGDKDPKPSIGTIVVGN